MFPPLPSWIRRKLIECRNRGGCGGGWQAYPDELPNPGPWEELVPAFTSIDEWDVDALAGSADVVAGKLVLTGFKGVLTHLTVPVSVPGQQYRFRVDVESFGGVGLAAVQYGEGVNQFGGEPISVLWTGGFGYPGTFSGGGLATNARDLTVSIAFTAGDLTISLVSLETRAL